MLCFSVATLVRGLAVSGCSSDYLLRSKAVSPFVSAVFASFGAFDGFCFFYAAFRSVLTRTANLFRDTFFWSATVFASTSFSPDAV